MIRIICGTCGTSQGYKTAADGPLILPDSEERRLVLRGVAEYVTTPIIGAAMPPPVPQVGIEGAWRDVDPPEAKEGADGPENAGDGKEPEMLTGHLDAAELETWKKGELEKLAEEMGVDISKAKNNAERAAILAKVEVQAPADEDEEDDDGEAPPELGAKEVVS